MEICFGTGWDSLILLPGNVSSMTWALISRRNRSLDRGRLLGTQAAQSVCSLLH
jgi:hypothetical protein